MAATFLNTHFGDRYEACCAGIEPSKTNANAVKALQEIGIDVSRGNPKNPDELKQEKFDCVITLCDFARANLTSLPAHKKELHKSFKNFCLPSLCENAEKFPMCFPAPNSRCDIKKIPGDNLAAFRYLREEIFNWLENEAVF